MNLILSNNAPPKANREYQHFVYNQPEFLKYNNEFEQVHFYGYVNNRAKIHAAFTIKEQMAYCPYRSPFGGIEYQKDSDQVYFSLFYNKLKNL